MFMLLVVAKPLIIILITETWLPSVPYLQIICISAVFIPLQSYYVNVFNIFGRSDKLLTSLVYSRIINLIIIIISVNFGITAIVIGQVLAEIINSLITQIFGLKFLKYSFVQQLLDIGRVFLPTMVIAGIVYFSHSWYSLFIVNNFLQIVINVILFTLLFLPVHLLINREIFLELVLMKKLFRKK